MSFPGRKSFWLAVFLGIFGLLCLALSAQGSKEQSASTEPMADADLEAAPPELPSPIKSPVDVFRELLAMDADQRDDFLADRPPEDQKRILAKIREYESLKPDQRELRLRVTELRWYLLPLMSAPRAKRQAQLGLIPALDRKLVEDRLIVWDILPPELKKELLENEATIRYFTELASSTEEQKRKILEGLSPARRAKLEEGITQWQSLAKSQRQKIAARFNQFFDLTSEEKQKALNTLSWPERRQLDRTLQIFGHLSATQRAECIRSFEKFASLSLEERQQFLKNAERWKLMTPDQRQAWRDVVTKLSSQPPMPPGWNEPPSPPGYRPWPPPPTPPPALPADTSKPVSSPAASRS